MPGPGDLDHLIEQLYSGDILSVSECIFVCEKVKTLMAGEPNIQPVSAPVSVVGDVHGQFYDVLELFRVGGKAPDTNYLFLGDFVDRGAFSINTISLLVCLKLRYPTRVTVCHLFLVVLTS